MAWTTPRTWVTSEIVTASLMNTHVRDNLNETAPGVVSTAGQLIVATGANAITARSIAADGVTTQETTTSTSFTNLTTTGPAVTVTTATTALIILSAQLWNTTANSVAFMSVAVSGATTAAAVDVDSLSMQSTSSNSRVTASRVLRYTGLTAGSNTFTAKYRCDSGTATFKWRYIAVLGL